MTQVCAGVVPARRALGYLAIGLLVVAAAGAGMVAAFGFDRLFTGLLIGLVAGVATLTALFGRDSVMLTEQGIFRRNPWSAHSIGWDRVVAGRFALDERARWTLALDLAGGDERHGELVLLSIPPVVGPVAGAYDLRKREQVTEIREMLRHKQIPITVLPEIAGALHHYWQIAPPTTR
ncbi:hypothetical protein D5S18_08970 [Nocardia panacis]|uniref:PH domain-containing protein n=1 Tax=Nocardia panacis TaxID=2340916 RepID=A0A3A4K9J2_9NOCA|nr:hypothetical protein [Nocardia panacis]RJO76440.1 hypothetical protein D5S18_08970 [Nocardia panacis]